MKNSIKRTLTALLLASFILAFTSVNTFATADTDTAGDAVTFVAEGQPEEEPTVLYTEAVSLIVEANTTPTLPDKIKVLMSNGEISTVPVVWDAVDPEKLKEECVFDISGKAEGAAEPAQCKITVISYDEKKVSEETPAVKVSGNITGLKKPIIKKLDDSDYVIITFKDYVNPGDVLCGYKICNNDGTEIIGDGEATEITIEVGKSHNGEQWTLLKIVEDKLEETACTVTDGVLKVSANDQSMNVVFKLPADKKASASNGKNTDGTAPVSKGGKGFTKWYIGLIAGFAAIVTAAFTIGRNTAIKDSSSSSEEDNVVLKYCKKFYLFIAEKLNLKKEEKLEIYEENKSEKEEDKSEDKNAAEAAEGSSDKEENGEEKDSSEE